MTIAQEIAQSMGNDWLPVIYEDKVRGLRTRSYEFDDIPARENRAEIQYTLLGIELKVGKLRMACPDLSTARYLRVFARIGCKSVAVPYDVSSIPGLADELEYSWQKTLLNVSENTKGRSQAARARSRSLVIGAIRDEIESIGAGDKMPLFKTSTRQRR
ncbi:MAG: hypothetical protein DWQ43_15500 [Acidobacteria bacterium]|nr:MAG: hypothetical protein DWQ32_09810 [Acidobacteriota bacterium]REK01978.1 MAG: hypothetical protein DWQ38_06245 [Acidobacteriota bacterium]REK14935.1 MAG: hypothetical protein DWQ43_15500 [Acidobacteriota bacterium]